MRNSLQLTCCGAALLYAAPSLAQSPSSAPGNTGTKSVEITEWTVPWEKTRPRDPYVDARGRVWFVGQVGNYVAYLEPSTGKFTRFEIDSGTHPHNLIVDRAGMVWYAGNRNGMIGKLDPATGAITRYPMPDSAVRDPHTLVFGNNGVIWFTAQQSGYVGRLTPASGRIETIKVATPRSRPYGIVIDRRGRAWFNLFGTNRIGVIDPVTMRIREFELPDKSARSRRLQITSDGGVWYVDYARGTLGRLDPKTSRVRDWSAPAGTASLPYAMAVDERDRLWFFETGVQPNRLVGFDPKTKKIFSMTTFGSAPNTVRHAYYHRPSRELWFGTDANTIARARLP